MVIFLIFELSKKELIKNILVKGYGGTVEPRYLYIEELLQTPDIPL